MLPFFLHLCVHYEERVVRKMNRNLGLGHLHVQPMILALVDFEDGLFFVLICFLLASSLLELLSAVPGTHGPRLGLGFLSLGVVRDR